MHKFNPRLMLTAVAAATLLAACGGGGGGVAANDPGSEVGQSVEKTVNFVRDLIANKGENSDPIDIDPITLAVDDTADPMPVE
jgi:hypothetical protein